MTDGIIKPRTDKGDGQHHDFYYGTDDGWIQAVAGVRGAAVWHDRKVPAGRSGADGLPERSGDHEGRRVGVEGVSAGGERTAAGDGQFQNRRR